MREGGDEPFAFEVEDVDGDGDEDADASEDRGGVVDVARPADVGVEGGCRERENAGEEIPAEAVTAGRGGGVRTVGANHVIDGGHVDGVIGDTDDGGKDHRTDPVALR